MTQTLATCVTAPEAHVDRRDDMTDKSRYINPKRVTVSNDEFMVTGIDRDEEVKYDDALTECYCVHACDVGADGGFCGYPLDDDGRCEVHDAD